MPNRYVEYASEEVTCLQVAALKALVGEQIGSGASRRVYALPLNSTVVIKLEYSKTFHNIAEYNIWNDVKGTEAAKWFAPVVQASECGMALVMERTQPIERDAFYSTVPELPWWFDDVHYANWGYLNGRVVCHDYAFTHFISKGIGKKSIRMKPNIDKWAEKPAKKKPTIKSEGTAYVRGYD